MKRLAVLLCLISSPALAQSELAGLSLRIQPVPVMPKNLQGRQGLWSLSTGPTANHTLLHTIGGIDVDLDAGGGGGGSFLPLSGGTMTGNILFNAGGINVGSSLIPVNKMFVIEVSAESNPLVLNSSTSQLLSINELTIFTLTSSGLTGASGKTLTMAGDILASGSRTIGSSGTPWTSGFINTLTGTTVGAGGTGINFAVVSKNLTLTLDEVDTPHTFNFAGGNLNAVGLNVIAAKVGPSAAQQHTLPAVASDTVALLAASQALTNKTISGASNTLSAIPDSAITYASQLQNLVFASPNGASGAPTYRALVAADIPSLSSTYLPLAGGTMAGNIGLDGDTRSVGDATHRVANLYALALNSGTSALTATSTVATGSSRPAFIINDTNGINFTDKAVSFRVNNVEKGWIGYHTTTTTIYGFRSAVDAMFQNSAGNGMTAQGTDLYFQASGGNMWSIVSANFLPVNDVSRTIGNSTQRVSEVWARHYAGSQVTAPTNTPGTGAGTGPTVSVTGSDSSGLISVLTGTAPAASAIVVTVTANATWAAAPKGIVITPANSAAAALTGAAQVYIDNASTTTTVFVLKVGSTNLAATTTYLWQYVAIQ